MELFELSIDVAVTDRTIHELERITNIHQYRVKIDKSEVFYIDCN